MRVKKWSFLEVLILGFIVAICGCKKEGEVDIQEPTESEGSSSGGGVSNVRPVVPVPPLEDYWWLAKANIKLGRESEIASVKAKIQNYYSGYPSFLKVLKLITKDRNVGLKDNSAYLTDIFAKYYELVGANPNDPFLVVTDYDAGIMKNALFLAWKKQNEFSAVDNYDDMVTRVDYGGGK